MSASLRSSGRHAVVTGAARGIGAEIAHRLAAEGASLTLLGRQREALQQLADSLPGTGHGIALADVTDVQAIAMIVQAGSCGARVDCDPRQQRGSSRERAISQDLHRAVAAHARRQPDRQFHLRAGGAAGHAGCWGRIVNIASTAGQRGYAYVSAYVAAKHGVIELTRAVALEVASKGVTVNSVCPGYTETDLLRESIANVIVKTGRSESQARADFAAVNPQRRLVQPIDVADALGWLCGDGAGSVTGQSISVSGGEVM